jgi:DnaJ domain
MSLSKSTALTRSNLLNLILLWGGLLLVGSGCATGIIDLDEEDQPSDCNESEEEPEESKKQVKGTKEDIKKHLLTLGFKENEHPDAKAVKKRYYELSRKHHPDKGGKTKIFQEINSAYAALEEYYRSK